MVLEASGVRDGWFHQLIGVCHSVSDGFSEHGGFGYRYINLIVCVCVRACVRVACTT